MYPPSQIHLASRSTMHLDHCGFHPDGRSATQRDCASARTRFTLIYFSTTWARGSMTGSFKVGRKVAIGGRPPYAARECVAASYTTGEHAPFAMPYSPTTAKRNIRCSATVRSTSTRKTPSFGSSLRYRLLREQRRHRVLGYERTDLRRSGSADARARPQIPEVGIRGAACRRQQIDCDDDLERIRSGHDDRHR